MERQIEKGFGLKRHLDYIKVNFFLMYKRMLEYKISTIFGFLEQIIFFITQFFFFFVISNHFSEVIGWSLLEFILLGLIIDTIWIIEGLFTWKMGFNLFLKKGNLNLLLTKPMHPFSIYNFSEISNVAFTMIIINIIAFIPLFIFSNININNIIIASLIFILIVLFRILFRFSYSAVSFFSYGLNQTLYNIDMEISNDLARQYPIQFFKETKLKYILNLIPLFFVSILLIPIINGENVSNFYLNLILLIFLILIFLIINLVLWHYGLKKYEAFG